LTIEHILTLAKAKAHRYIINAEAKWNVSNLY
jgi:hypothetical protein